MKTRDLKKAKIKTPRTVWTVSGEIMVAWTAAACACERRLDRRDKGECEREDDGWFNL
jgi:hypothetical protein